MNTCLNCRHYDNTFECYNKKRNIILEKDSQPWCADWQDIIETDSTQELVCPYCGYEDTDSWEYDQNTFDGVLGDIECGECGKKFHAQRNGEITYSTWIDKETEGGKNK